MVSPAITEPDIVWAVASWSHCECDMAPEGTAVLELFASKQTAEQYLDSLDGGYVTQMRVRSSLPR